MSGEEGAAHDADWAPAVILIEPQLGENIGTTARAMLNCGLTDLRLVKPREQWPHPKAIAAASGADIVLDRARLFDRTEDAIADLGLVYATTARDRDMLKPVVTPRAAAREIHRRAAEGTRTGLLFGRERSGMTNEDVSLADAILTAPLNPRFTSLNLAQAVLLVAWEWRAAGDETPDERLTYHEHQPPATKEQLVNFFEHLEGALDQTAFFRVPDKRPAMISNIRAMLTRAQLSTQEVRTLHGIVVALSGLRKGDQAG